MRKTAKGGGEGEKVKTTIQVRTTTRAKLKKRKLAKRETYDNALNRVLDMLDKVEEKHPDVYRKVFSEVTHLI